MYLYHYNIDGIQIVLEQPIYQATYIKDKKGNINNRHNYPTIARWCQLYKATSPPKVGKPLSPPPITDADEARVRLKLEKYFKQEERK